MYTNRWSLSTFAAFAALTTYLGTTRCENDSRKGT